MVIEVLAVLGITAFLVLLVATVWSVHRPFFREAPRVTSVMRMGAEGHRYEHPRNVYRSPWGTWYVQLRWHGERIYLGAYETQDDAVAARDAFLALNAMEGPGEPNHEYPGPSDPA